MTILKPENDHISKVIIGQICLRVDFIPLKYKKQMVYFAFIKIDFVRKFQYFQCYDSFYTHLVLQGSIISFKILFALIHIKITPS